VFLQVLILGKLVKRQNPLRIVRNVKNGHADSHLRMQKAAKKKLFRLAEGLEAG